MSFCANCCQELEESENTISLFDILYERDKTTVSKVIQDLFGVSDRFTRFLQVHQSIRDGDNNTCTPRICQRCFDILKHSFKWRKQFLNLCHPEGVFWSFLCDIDENKGSTGQNTISKFQLKPCSVVINPVQVDVKTEPAWDVEPEPSWADNYDSEYNFVEDGTSGFDPVSGIEQVICTPQVHTGRSTDEAVVDNKPATRKSTLRSRFKCGHCHQTFCVASALHEHELVHKYDCSEFNDPYEDNEEVSLRGSPIPESDGSGEIKSESENMNFDSIRMTKKKSKKRKLHLRACSKGSSTKRVKRAKVEIPKNPVDIDALFEELKIDTAARFTCDECRITFHFQAEWISHCVINHQRDIKEFGTEKCSDCEYNSAFPMGLLRHIFKSHTKEERFACLKCSFKCPDLIEMRRHCVSHVIDTEVQLRRKDWTCGLCFKTLFIRDIHDLKRHIQCHVRPFQCPQCNENFSTASFMANHFKKIHGGELPPTPSIKEKIEDQTERDCQVARYKIPTTEVYQCESCEQNFNYEAHLKAHVLVEHSSSAFVNKKFRCTFCDYSTLSKHHLAEHFFIHTKEKMFKCDFPECNYGTHRLVRLQEHLNAHIRPYEGTRKMHVEKERGNINEREIEIARYKIPVTEVFQCEMCDQSFSYEARLKAHALVEHSSSPSVDKNFKCTLCEYSTQSKSHLAEHFFIHTKEKRYQCDFPECNFGTHRSVRLKEHINVNGHIYAKEGTRRTQVENERHDIIDINGREIQIARYKIPTTEVFQCESCEQSFPYEARMKAHVLVEHSSSPSVDKKFKCPYCDYSTQSKHYITEHFFIHTKEKRYKCDFPGCNYATHRSVRLKEHINGYIHAKEGAQKELVETERLDIAGNYEMVRQSEMSRCDLCQETYAFKAELLSHTTSEHTEDGDGAFHVLKCTEPECDFVSNGNYEFTSHMFTHTKECRFRCLWETCSFTSVGQVDIRKHVVNHFHKGEASTLTKPYRCELCKQLFSNRRRYSKHMDIHIRPYECTFCGKLFANTKNLSTHGKYHSGPEANDSNEKPKKYRCSKCGKRFHNKGHCEEHTVVHVDEKPFECPICLKEFRLKLGLQRHIRAMHKGTATRLEKDDDCKGMIGKIIPTTTFTCEQCPKKFRFQAVLLTHIQMDHSPNPDQLVTDTGRVFPCGSCSLVARTKQSLIWHYCRVHTKEKAFKCIFENCTYEAVTSTEVRFHLRTGIHGNVSRIQCERCGLLFSGQHLLDRHIKKSHQ